MEVEKETDLQRRTAEGVARWRMADGAAVGRRPDLFSGATAWQQEFLTDVAAPTQVAKVRR